MSNNYSQHRITVFPSRDERDLWLARCSSAASASPGSFRTLEGFEALGDRCLTIWHTGSVKTAHMSKLLPVAAELARDRSDLPWIGRHSVEGFEYCFDAGVRGSVLSFNELDIMMSDDEEDQVRAYSSWAAAIQRQFPPDPVPPGLFPTGLDLLDSAGSDFRGDFVRSVKTLRSVHSLVSRAKTDQQVSALFEIFEDLLPEVSNSYRRYESLPESAPDED